ncbi:hypothetical protein P7K49_009125 [Saguinus oedipus]|uniref:Uncharacterized protein n=1 Tax=Saguinus oedipus TaxID=9490 RepID=A0ABQ9VZS8_SAGOE|nr:hypothetical protein P7K49_009125 [Saguinus oedipus]
MGPPGLLHTRPCARWTREPQKVEWSLPVPWTCSNQARLVNAHARPFWEQPVPRFWGRRALPTCVWAPWSTGHLDDAHWIGSDSWYVVGLNITCGSDRQAASVSQDSWYVVGLNIICGSDRQVASASQDSWYLVGLNIICGSDRQAASASQDSWYVVGLNITCGSDRQAASASQDSWYLVV